MGVIVQRMVPAEYAGVCFTHSPTDRGEIAHATSRDGAAWTYRSVVLREPFHLSYPQVFEWDGAIYMVPESRQDAAVHLYVAEAFPTRDPTLAGFARRVDQFVPEPLVVPLQVVVLHVLPHDPSKMTLPQRNHARQGSSRIERTNRSA